MLELADRILPALRCGEPVAVVTVSRVARSAPRGPGAAMAVLRDGTVIGSISGGCVEGDAMLLAHGVLARGGVVTASLGYSDDAAHAAGLGCGGSVDVVVHRVEPDSHAALAALEQAAAGRFAAVEIEVDGEHAGRMTTIDDRRAGTGMHERAYDGVRVFTLVQPARPRLVVVGAGEHAIALARLGAAAGWSVAVCDVWERLVTRERFATADRLEVGDPAALLADLVDDPAASAVCVLTHDERVDVPAIAAALTLGVAFVGAMGARSTVAHRRRLLTDAGCSPAQLDRLHSPLGLDLGGASPEETALSVLAEIVAARHGGSARALRDTRGALHPRAQWTASDAGSCQVAGSIG